MKTNIRCPFTDRDITNKSLNNEITEYDILISENLRTIKYLNSTFPFIKNYLENDKKWIVKGLILNGIWHNDEFTTIENLEVLTLTNLNLIPKTPKEKKDKLLSFLYNKQGFDGNVLSLNNDENQYPTLYWNHLFLRNRKEVIFYLNYLQEENYITFSKNSLQDIVSLKTKAIEYVLNLNEGNYSNKCFVAMSFSDYMYEIYDEAIMPAIQETEFNPILISNEIIESDRTINDAIIGELKKARFTIADFTENKDGVYFEAGFALGRGQKVIYCCKESELGNLHFDVRAFQHIVWKDAKDYKKKLIDKINAFIKD